MEPIVYHFNLYEMTTMKHYVEMTCEKVGKWYITVDDRDFVLLSDETDPLKLLQEALRTYHNTWL